MDADDIMPITENDIAHENRAFEELSDYNEEGVSSENVGRIPNSGSETEAPDGYSVMKSYDNGTVESVTEEVEESNNLAALKVLRIEPVIIEYYIRFKFFYG